MKALVSVEKLVVDSHSSKQFLLRFCLINDDFLQSDTELWIRLYSISVDKSERVRFSEVGFLGVMFDFVKRHLNGKSSFYLTVTSI